MFDARATTEPPGGRTPRRAPRARRAFTLLELVVVVTVIGTVAAIAVPRYALSTSRFRADSAARRIAADLRYAARVAETTSSSVTVRFVVGQDRYVVPGVTGPDRSGPPYHVDLTRSPYDATLFHVLFDDQADDSDAPDEVVFNGFGFPDSGGSVVVQSGQVARTVSIDEATGRVTVQ